MMKRIVLFVLLMSITFLIGAPHCFAKTKGYLYVVSYSAVQKKIYLSNIIIQKVRNISYSDEEFVSEVELIQTMESQFIEYLVSTERVNPAEYTTTVRGAYKSNAIAEKRLNGEREQFSNKGYSIKVLSDFKYSN